MRDDILFVVSSFVVLLSIGLAYGYLYDNKDIAKNDTACNNSIEVYSKIMSDSEYICNRLEAQRQWHSKKSSDYQKNYKITQYVNWIALSLVPLVNIIDIQYVNSEICSTLFSVIAGGACFMEKNNEYKKKWLLYRMISEQLKKEKYMYMTRVGMYKDDSYDRLVSRCESVIETGNVEWYQFMSDKNDE